MVPYAAGCLYLGATNRVAWHPADNPQIDDVVTLLRESKSRFNGELGHSRVVDLRVGNRPMTIDGFPLIGPTSVPGIFIASGTYRSGFHLAPLIGNQIANAVLSPTSAGLESAFLPERRPIDYLSVECAIGVVSESLRATKYGRDHRVEGGGFDETRVRQVYERWANVFVPPPEIYPLFEGDSAFLARLMRDFSVS
jgi:hypothetical protein